MGRGIADPIKRFRQSMFKLEFKVRRLGGGEGEAGEEGEALREQVCASGRKCSMRHIAGASAGAGAPPGGEGSP